MNAEVAVVGAGVVGGASALALARRGARVAVLEAEAEPALGASATNSGVLHTGFDSPPGELETDLILRARRLREPLLETLGVPFRRCGALMRSVAPEQRRAIEALEQNARRNGVAVRLRGDGGLEVPGEAITNPVAYTLALIEAARLLGADLRTGYRVAAIERTGGGFALASAEGERVSARVVVNSAGLGAHEVARLAGDDSFEIYPRKGEFLVFDPPDEEPLEQILLPVPTKSTKGVLVFPTLDGKVVAGPTAVDQEDPADWSVRPSARDEILPKAMNMYPALNGAEPIAAYAGLRPAGRGVNYVIGHSRACPGLVNAVAIRSTGLTASPAIGERVRALVGELGVELGAERPLERPAVSVGGEPWWRRTARYRAP